MSRGPLYRIQGVIHVSRGPLSYRGGRTRVQESCPGGTLPYAGTTNVFRGPLTCPENNSSARRTIHVSRLKGPLCVQMATCVARGLLTCPGATHVPRGRHSRVQIVDRRLSVREQDRVFLLARGPWRVEQGVHCPAGSEILNRVVHELCPLVGNIVSDVLGNGILLLGWLLLKGRLLKRVPKQKC